MTRIGGLRLVPIPPHQYCTCENDRCGVTHYGGAWGVVSRAGCEPVVLCQLCTYALFVGMRHLHLKDVPIQ